MVLCTGVHAASRAGVHATSCTTPHAASSTASHVASRTAPRIATRAALCAAAACLCIFGLLCMLATPAYAMETMRCTARPNSDASSDVMGGSETRITWEGQADADEALVAISLTLPDNTSYSLDNARLTLLGGEDLMDRLDIEYEFSSDGQTVTVTFAEVADPGGYFRIEIYGVVFPTSGGEYQVMGTYTLADGSTRSIDDIPVITVVSVTFFEQVGTWLSEQDWVVAANQNSFIRLFLNPVLIVTSLPTVFKGFLYAILTVAIAFPLAIPIGFVVSLMRMSKFRLFRAIASLYVNIVRGTPLFLQIYIAFLGLPLAGISIPNMLLGVLVLSMNSGAYLCEIFRAGIQSIPKGQFEASRSLGMNGAQTMLFVIIPQTVRRVIPTMTSEFILLYKDTSMLAAVGIMEIVMQARTIVANTGSITPYIVAALFYLVITLPLAKVVSYLEARLAGNDTGTATPRKQRRKKVLLSDGSVFQEVETRDAQLAQRGAAANQKAAITPEQMSSL